MDEILSFMATWIELEGHILGKISNAKKNTASSHSFVEVEMLNLIEEEWSDH